MSDGSFHYFGLAKEIQPTTTWATISAPFTPPANATHITLFHLISAVGYVEIDDAAMYEVGVGTPSETNVPIVEFTNPLNGQTVSGSVTLTASSTDDTAVTYIFYAVDGIPITGQITAPPYSYVWDTTAFAAGVHTIKATTHDPSGNNSTHTISVTVDNTTPPPAAGNLVQNPSFETVGATTDPAQWSRGGWGTNNRTYTYPVTGFDGLKAARVAITSFTNGDAKWYFTDVPVTAGQTYVVSHRYKSDAATEVLARFTLPGGVYQYQFLGSVASAPAWTVNSYSVLAPANASALTIFHVLHSVGTLDVDDFSVTPPGATLDTVAPSVVLTGPINNATVSSITTVTASSSDATAVAGVALVVDGVVQGAEDTTSPYSFAWDTSSASNGPHSLAARSRDTVGNVATSSAIAVTVSNGAGLQSLIANPSLSVVGTPGNPANWTRNSWGTNTTIFTYPVVGPTDTSAARIEMTSFTDGDAKWRHDDVPVTPGVVYTFTHEYRASVLTNLTARYTLANGTYQYISLGNFPAAAAWTPITQTFTAPVNATSVTILHILNAVGSLETDNYALTTGNTNQFANGMISLTFDDGWLSHYTAALPILNAANVKGVFHIVSQETLNAVPVERIVNASLEADAGNGNPAEWSRGGWGTNAATFTYPVQGFVGASAAKVEIASYTDGDAKWYFTDVPVQGAHSYVLKDSYNSNVSTEIVLRVMRTGGVTQYMFLATLPSTAGAWANFNQTVVMPTDATSVTLFHVIHSTGSLTVDNYSVKHVQDFVDAAQMMAMQSSGHEISGHTQTHADLTTLAPADAQAQLTNSRSDLISLGATPVSTMAYPYGAFNTNVQQMARNAGFVAARGVEHGYNTRASDKFGLLIQRMDRTVTLATVQGWINQAKLDNTWLILMFHQIDDVQTETLGVSAQLLSDTVNAVVTSGIEVVNLQTGVSRMNP